MSIDVHAHCVPAGLVARMRAPGLGVDIQLAEDGAVSVAGRRLALPLREDLVDRDARLRAMDGSGVDVQLLSSWIDLTAYALDADEAPRWSRLLNEALAEEAATEPDRFRALATVPLQRPDAASAELRHAIAALGLVGVEIGTSVAGTRLSDASLEPFWAAAAELGCLVLLHPLDALRGIDLRAHFLENLVGRPAESTIAAADLLLSGIVDRHPGLTICVVHGGGFLPYQLGRLQRGWDAKPTLVAKDAATAPAAAAGNLYYDTVLHSPEALRYLIDLVGAERVLLGTDYPFEMGDPEPLQTVARIPGLTVAERDAITTDNARAMLERMGQ